MSSSNNNSTTNAPQSIDPTFQYILDTNPHGTISYFAPGSFSANIVYYGDIDEETVKRTSSCVVANKQALSSNNKQDNT